MIIIIIFTHWIVYLLFKHASLYNTKSKNRDTAKTSSYIHAICVRVSWMIINHSFQSTKDVGKQWKLSRDIFANSGSKLLICKLKRYLAPSHMYKIQIIVANHTCDGWTKIIKPFNETKSWRQKILTSGTLNISIYEVFAFATGNFHTIVGYCTFLANIP